MEIRIGISDTSKVVEMDVEDPTTVVEQIEAAFADGVEMLWFVDVKNRRVGVPRTKLAFVEVEQESLQHRVGFAPAAEV